jgi:hypothetical protein
MRCGQCHNPFVRGQLLAKTRNGTIMHARCYNARVRPRPMRRMPRFRPPLEMVQEMPARYESPSSEYAPSAPSEYAPSAPSTPEPVRIPPSDTPPSPVSESDSLPSMKTPSIIQLPDLEGGTTPFNLKLEGGGYRENTPVKNDDVFEIDVFMSQ